MPKASTLMPIVLDMIFCVSLTMVTCPDAYGSTPGSQQAAYLKSAVIIGDLPSTNSSDFGVHAPGLKVKYERACGETFRGILVNEQENVVQVGVVIERSATVCSGLSRPETLVLPISTSKAIEVLPERGSSRLLLLEATDVSLAKGHLFVSWQDTCRPIAGVLISPVSNHGVMTLGINLLQSPSEPGSTPQPTATACRFETTRIDLTSIHIPSNDVSLVRRPGEVKSLYALGLRAPRSLAVSPSGTLSITWDKTCQEKAVGAIFSGVEGNSVAVVSVFSPNANCRSTTTSEDVYTVKEVSVPKSGKLVAMSRQEILAKGKKANFKYNLLPISSLSLTRQGSLKGASASVLPTCFDAVGLVVGADSIGNVAMAVMAASQDKICTVQKSSTVLSLQSPITGPATGPMPKIFGLKVFGTSIN